MSIFEKFLLVGVDPSIEEYTNKLKRVCPYPTYVVCKTTSPVYLFGTIYLHDSITV